MKCSSAILILLVLAACAFGQVKKDVAPKEYVQMVITDSEVTSELLPMPVGISPNLSGAEVGIKYLGPQTKSDISFILLLQGTKNRYSAPGTFGVKLYADDIPLSKSKYRMVSLVDKKGGMETLRFHITTEELAWLATADSVKIEVYNSDTEQKHDTLTLTPTGFAEFKRFAKSVFLIRSQFN